MDIIRKEKNAILFISKINEELFGLYTEEESGVKVKMAELSTVEKEDKIIRDKANKKSEEIRGGGDAQAIEIAASAFGADPEFYEFYRTLESYRQSIKPGSTFLLSTNNEYTKHLTNCLPKK
jgi:membrane protease subunit HflC